MERHFCVTTYVEARETGEFLMVLHKKLGRWLPPGGHVEVNEKPEDAARRECFEETGVEVQLTNIATSVDGGLLVPNGIQLNVISEGNHEHMDIIYHGYASKNDFLSKQKEEVLDIGWFTVEDICSEEFSTFLSVKQWVKKINRLKDLDFDKSLFETQMEIADFLQRNNFITTPQIRVIDLASEVGELSKEVLKCTNYGTKEFKSRDSFVEEFGDVIFSLFALANESNINFNEALTYAIKKYNKRLNKNGTIDSSAEKE